MGKDELQTSSCTPTIRLQVLSILRSAVVVAGSHLGPPGAREAVLPD